MIENINKLIPPIGDFEKIMHLSVLADRLGSVSHSKTNPLDIYNDLRNSLFAKFFTRVQGTYQSPSWSNSPLSQSSTENQSRIEETYLRYDFNPIDLEEQFNSGHCALDGIEPVTLFFHSGMSAINTILVYLRKALNSHGACIGTNIYFEANRLIRQFFRVQALPEDKFRIAPDVHLIWIDYPLSDEPNYFPDLRAIISEMIDNSTRRYDQEYYIVIDYTLAGFAFDIRKYIRDLPYNLHIFLVSSLQKHMTYGLDTATGGALTVYSRTNEIILAIRRLRSYCGAILSERSAFLLPPIEPALVKEIIIDAGKNACDLAKAVTSFGSPRLKIHYQFDTPMGYRSSLVFIELPEAVTTQRSNRTSLDQLLDQILIAAKKRDVPLVHGASFGFPMTRICKFDGGVNSDLRSLRFGVGYDEDLANSVIPAINDGIQAFLATT
ncbi:MAG: hypothetical protein ACRDF4_00935 [Rhabdochlamydiaceae bacterium]